MAWGSWYSAWSGPQDGRAALNELYAALNERLTFLHQTTQVTPCIVGGTATHEGLCFLHVFSSGTSLTDRPSSAINDLRANIEALFDDIVFDVGSETCTAHPSITLEDAFDVAGISGWSTNYEDGPPIAPHIFQEMADVLEQAVTWTMEYRVASAVYETVEGVVTATTQDRSARGGIGVSDIDDYPDSTRAPYFWSYSPGFRLFWDLADGLGSIATMFSVLLGIPRSDEDEVEDDYGTQYSATESFVADIHGAGWYAFFRLWTDSTTPTDRAYAETKIKRTQITYKASWPFLGTESAPGTFADCVATIQQARGKTHTGGVNTGATHYITESYTIADGEIGLFIDGEVFDSVATPSIDGVSETEIEIDDPSTTTLDDAVLGMANEQTLPHDAAFSGTTYLSGLDTTVFPASTWPYASVSGERFTLWCTGILKKIEVTQTITALTYA